MNCGEKPVLNGYVTGGQVDDPHHWIDDGDVNDLFPHKCKVAYCYKFEVGDTGYF